MTAVYLPLVHAQQQAERSPIARRTVTVLTPYIYLAQRTTAISGVCCLAPKSMRKTVNIVNYISKKYSRISGKLLLQNSLVLTITNVLNIFTKLYIAQFLLTFQSRCLPFCFFRPAKIQYVECFQDNTCHN